MSQTTSAVTAFVLAFTVRMLFAGDFAFIEASRTGAAAPLPSAVPVGAEEFTVPPPRAADDKNIVRISENADLNAKLSENADDNLQGLIDIFTYMKSRHGDAPSKLVLPRGVFRVKIGAKKELALLSMSDFTLDGNGATLLFSYRSPEDANVNPLHLLRISTCRDVKIHNLIMDWDWDIYPITSVAEVTRIDPDADSVSFRVYDMSDARKRQFDSCPSIYGDFQPFDYGRGAIGVQWVNTLGITSDAVMTRRWGSPAKKFFEEDTSWSSDEVTLKTVKEKRNWMRSFVKPGFQYLVRHYVYNTGAFWLVANTNLTLANVTVYSAPGMGIRGGEGKGHHTLLSNFRIMNKPGTYGKRYCTVAADGMNFGSTLGYLIIDNCRIENNLDDGINIHDKIHVSVTFTPGGREIVLNDFQWRTPFDVGDRIELQMPDRRPLDPPFIAIIVEKKIVPKSGAVNRYASLLLDRELPAIAADQKKIYVLNRSYDSGNYIIRDTTISGNKGRGMLLQSPNGTVDNCRVIGNRKHALDLESEMTSSWGEGYTPENIVIRSCTFENNNVETVWNQHRQSPVVRIGAVVGEYWKPEDDLAWGLLKNILFISNVINAYPSAVMQLTACENVIIFGNVFQNVTRVSTPGRERNGAIIVNYGRNIAVLNNRWGGENVEHRGIYYDTSRVKAEDIISRGNTAHAEILMKERETLKISLCGLRPESAYTLRITFRTGDDGGIYRVSDEAGMLTPAAVDTYSAQNGVKDVPFSFRSPKNTDVEMKLSFTCEGKNAASRNYYLKRYDGSGDNGKFSLTIIDR
ncbi:MAG: right-handed parallel beta-helix repeat-containing protein [Spirochaetota bacterium]